MGDAHFYVDLAKGLYVRDLVTSGVCERLYEATGTPSVVLSPAYLEPEFRALFGDGAAIVEDLRFFDDARIGTWRRRILRALTSRDPQRRHDPAWSAGNRYLSSVSGYEALFNAYPPRALVIPRAGHFVLGESASSEHLLFAAAAQRGVPVVMPVSSWDNPQKSLGIEADAYLVWSDWMKEQVLQRYPRIDPDAVLPTGAPQFDPYFLPGFLQDRDDFLMSLGLDPSKRVVLLATSGTGLDETFVLEMLLAEMDARRLPRDLHIVVRLHPWDSPVPFQKWSSVESVHIDSTGTRLRSIGWAPTEADIRHAGNLIAHSSVLVNMATTMTLEAAVFDTPTVVVGFSQYQPQQFRRIIFDRTFRQHFADIVRRDLVPVAESAGSLARCVQESLADPASGRAARRALVETYVQFTDGLSSDRCASAIVQTTERE